jgi:hypothetical protein
MGWSYKGQGQCHFGYWQLSGFCLRLFQRGVWFDMVLITRGVAIHVYFRWKYVWNRDCLCRSTNAGIPGPYVLGATQSRMLSPLP